MRALHSGRGWSWWSLLEEIILTVKPGVIGHCWGNERQTSHSWRWAGHGGSLWTSFSVSYLRITCVFLKALIPFPPSSSFFNLVGDTAFASSALLIIKHVHIRFDLSRKPKSWLNIHPYQTPWREFGFPEVTASEVTLEVRTGSRRLRSRFLSRLTWPWHGTTDSKWSWEMHVTSVTRNRPYLLRVNSCFLGSWQLSNTGVPEKAEGGDGKWRGCISHSPLRSV